MEVGKEGILWEKGRRGRLGREDPRDNVTDRLCNVEIPVVAKIWGVFSAVGEEGLKWERCLWT